MARLTGLTLDEIQALATAIPKYLPNFGFLIASNVLTTAQVMTQVNAALASASLVATTTAAAKDARIADAKARVTYVPFLKELREIVKVGYSNATTTLADFEITPPKPRAPLSAAARAAAEVKAKATRAARGTKGKKQKAAITGNVTGVNITPVLTPAAAPAAPEPNAPAPTPTVGTGTNGTPTHT